MKIGAMTILFREKIETDVMIDHIESMTRIRAAGFAAADLNLCLLANNKTELHLDSWQTEAEKIMRTAEKLGLSLPQCHLPFKSKRVKWREPQDFEYYIKMFYRAIDVASYIGIPWGVIHPDTLKNTELTPEEKLKKNHENNDALIEYALKKNLNIAYENMPYKACANNYCSEAKELCELIDSYNDSRIGACWDTGHANMLYDDQGDPLRLVGDRLHCTHIDDNKGSDDLHQAPYSGTVKWDTVMTGLRDINYSGDLILEVFVNAYTPDCLKDASAKYAYQTAEHLLKSI